MGNDPIGSRDPLGLWCVGASGYAGAGAGAEICCSGGKCSLCVEVGLGVGGGASVGSGNAKKDKEKDISAEAGIGCGPANFGLGCSLDMCGKADCSGKADILGIEIDSGGNAKTGGDVNFKPTCSIGGKIAAKSCVGE